MPGTIVNTSEAGSRINLNTTAMAFANARAHVKPIATYFALDEHVKTEFPKLRDMLHRRG